MLFYQFLANKKALVFSTSHVILTGMASSIELQAITGQLYIAEGVVQDSRTAPGLMAQSSPPKATRGRQKDSLFIHLSLSGQPEDTAVLSQDLMDAIGQHYFQSTGSVTASLRQAVMEANQLLLRLNISGASDVHEGAISCAVLRNGELFMVQAGEALALLGHNFGVERLPPTAPDRITPLGRTAGVDVRFFHHRLQSGDMLLLADPRIAHLPSSTLSPALVDTEVELGLAELTGIIGLDSARLLLIEFTDHLPEIHLADSKPFVRHVEAGPEQSSDAPPTLQPRRERSRLPSIPARERQPQPIRPSPLRATPKPNINLETSARKATSDAAMGLSRFTGWLADLLTRLRPPQTGETESTTWAIPASAAIIIPVIMALIVGSVYIRYGEGQRFAEIKDQMGQNIGLAEEAGSDQGLSAGYYNAVLILAEEAEALRPGDPEVARLRQQALTNLDRLEDITRLVARPLREFEAATRLSAVVLRDGFNGGIYALDGANSRVYQQPTDESYLITTSEPETILFSGQAVGSHIVNNIVDIIWRPMGSDVSRDGLAMLDSTGAVITYYPNFADTRAVPLGFASDWQFPRAMTTFLERLYILDNGASQIWKYFPEGDGFLQKDDERTLFFSENPGLESAVDLAIYSEDGSLVVLYDDGRIRYYDTRSGRVQWNEAHLLQNGLGTPLVSPIAVEMVGKGLNSSIFVADPGSGRIIQISRGGTVLAQYRASDDRGHEIFTSITDFAIAETPLRIFVTSGSTLYAATQ